MPVDHLPKRHRIHQVDVPPHQLGKRDPSVPPAPHEPLEQFRITHALTLRRKVYTHCPERTSRKEMMIFDGGEEVHADRSPPKRRATEEGLADCRGRE